MMSERRIMLRLEMMPMYYYLRTQLTSTMHTRRLEIVTKMMILANYPPRKKLISTTHIQKLAEILTKTIPRTKYYLAMRSTIMMHTQRSTEISMKNMKILQLWHIKIHHLMLVVVLMKIRVMFEKVLTAGNKEKRFIDLY